MFGKLGEEGERFGHGHFEDIVDRPALELHLEDVRLETFAAAGRADEGDIAEELHFDALVTETGAAFAASGIRVEAESGSPEPGAFGRGGLGEEIADVVPRAEINHRGGARRFAGR